MGDLRAVEPIAKAAAVADDIDEHDIAENRPQVQRIERRNRWSGTLAGHCAPVLQEELQPVLGKGLWFRIPDNGRRSGAGAREQAPGIAVVAVAKTIRDYVQRTGIKHVFFSTAAILSASLQFLDRLCADSVGQNLIKV